jgi:uncharacterized protein (TIGR02466 family)
VVSNKRCLETSRLLIDRSLPYLKHSPTGILTTLVEHAIPYADVTWNPLEDDNVGPLLLAIKELTEEHLEKCGYHPYDITIPNMWINVMDEKSCHPPHTHYGYTFSGTYYVDIPEGSGEIILHNQNTNNHSQVLFHVKTFKDVNAGQFKLPVEDGTLVIFPSYLRHSVGYMPFKGTRRSISFDVTCRPIN